LLELNNTRIPRNDRLNSNLLSAALTAGVGRILTDRNVVAMAMYDALLNI
jgi:hypothetical protein